ncbi:MAG: tetratricopeptide repeat protein [Myxococcales bacterium]|nr:tetratricopeptide repeat protein [Myxococcales bacterium]
MKKTVVALAVALVALLATVGNARADDEDAKKARAHYTAATRYYNVGDFRQALESFKQAYIARADAVFLFNMGQCYRQMGEPEGAVRQYRAYLRESPEAPNRAAVEGFIVTAEQQIKEKAANVPPTGVMRSPDPVEAAPKEGSPSVTAPKEAPPAASVVASPSGETGAEKPSRRGLWIGVAVGGAVAVVAAVTLAVLFTVPNDAAARDGTIPGATMVMFP